MRVNLQGRPASRTPNPSQHTFFSGLYFDAFKENSNHLSLLKFNLLLSPPPEIGAVLGPGKGPRSRSQVTWVSVLVQPRSHLSPSHLGSDSVGRRDPIMSWLRAQALAPDTVGSVQASPSFISHVAEPLWACLSFPILRMGVVWYLLGRVAVVADGPCEGLEWCIAHSI